MPISLKWNALAVTGLAAVSWSAFMFAKHGPALRPIIPFGDDPYDAVGSFAVIGAALLAAISLIRAFRPRPTKPSAEAELYLLRSEGATVLTVYALVASDAVAMARHPSAWLSSPAMKQLIALIAGLTVLATGTVLLIQRSRRRTRTAGGPVWARAIVVAAASTLALSLYPERLISSFLPHLLTIVFGDVILFAPIGFLLPAMFPSEEIVLSAAEPQRRPHAWIRWATVLLVGIGLGSAILVGELGEGGPPAGRLLLVAAVYLGLTIAGVVIAYALLGKAIGLGSQSPR